jgi:hypothetical protein
MQSYLFAIFKTAAKLRIILQRGVLMKLKLTSHGSQNVKHEQQKGPKSTLQGHFRL